MFKNPGILGDEALRDDRHTGLVTANDIVSPVKVEPASPEPGPDVAENCASESDTLRDGPDRGELTKRPPNAGSPSATLAQH